MEQALHARFEVDDVAETVDDFIRMDVVRNARRMDKASKPIKVENFPLSTIVLNVNTGCNLSCTYCYKEDLTTPDKGQKMAFETAVKSFELLL